MYTANLTNIAERNKERWKYGLWWWIERHCWDNSIPWDDLQIQLYLSIVLWHFYRNRKVHTISASPGSHKKKQWNFLLVQCQPRSGNTIVKIGVNRFWLLGFWLSAMPSMRAKFILCSLMTYLHWPQLHSLLVPE